ncbi:MAG: hypothetical protein ACYTE8_11930 [Planctomycetota bacterium]|jgi:type II secretory pathway pseudopilin PulG
MSRKRKQSGFTLPEQVLVIAGVVLLAAITMPAVKAFFKTFESVDAAKTMINSALTSARAIAVKHQRYAGIRFQKAGYYGQTSIATENIKQLMQASQYIVFIVHDPAESPDGTGLKTGFKAVEGIEPIKLPNSIGVMDLKHRRGQLNNTNEYIDIDNNNEIDETWELRDTTSFSIIFSPTGKMVVRDVRVFNKNGVNDFQQTLLISRDDIFNTVRRVTREYIPASGMFVQDDYENRGLGLEPSRRSFLIYEKDKLQDAYQKNAAYSEYLGELEYSDEVFINPYTGTMITSKPDIN